MFHCELGNDLTATGYIIFYGEDTNEGRSLSYIFWFENFYRDRVRRPIQIIRGANQKHEQIEFWVVSQGAEPPKPERDFVKLAYTIKTRFDLGDGSINPDTGEIVNSFWELGCNFSPNIKGFADILINNQNLNGLIIVNNPKNREANKVANLLIKKLLKSYKIPGNRFTLQFLKRAQFGEIELWLVPKRRKS